jgi:hypothetical protein
MIANTNIGLYEEVTVVTYSRLTIENQNYIVEKAKLKKNGCYQIRGIAYRVRDGKVTHFAVGGQVLQPYGAFNVVVGTYSGNSDEAKKVLLKL